MSNTIFMNTRSVAAARFAAGGTLEALDAVLSKRLESALCVVRWAAAKRGGSAPANIEEPLCHRLCHRLWHSLIH